MSAFTEYNWKIALNKVFRRSMSDPEYRSLCLADPYAAVAQVSDIELPPSANLRFYDKRAEYVYAFLLPPTKSGDDSETTADELVEWNTLCTDFTVTVTHPDT